MALIRLIPTHDPYQALRLRRFLAAVLIYVVTIALLAVYVAEGLLRPRQWLLTSLAIVLVNTLYFVILRSGRNERLRDPSLTAAQMVTACLLLSLALLQVDGARGALLLLLLVLLMFGAFRVRMRAFLIIGVFAVTLYVGVVVLLLRTRPGAVELSTELLQLLAFAAAVPWGGFFVDHVALLRRELRARQVELQRARETVHELAVQDSLTGVSNRNRIVQFVAEERERANRLTLPLSVALIDLDEFTAINRRHGHEAGDRVLAQLAEVLRVEVRNVDELGRYGGDEFLVVMPDTDADGALSNAEAWRQRLVDYRVDGLQPPVTLAASIGVAEYQPPETAWNLIERARLAADEAHSGGEGCAPAAPPEPIPSGGGRS